MSGGKRPASPVNNMEVFLQSAEIPMGRRLPVAVAYLDPQRLDWYAVADPRHKKPKDWGGLKRMLAVLEPRRRGERELGTSEANAYGTGVPQAVAECRTLKEEQKLELFIDNFQAESAEAVEATSPMDLEGGIREPVRAEGRINRRKSVKKPSRTAAQHVIV